MSLTACNARMFLSSKIIYLNSICRNALSNGVKSKLRDSHMDKHKFRNFSSSKNVSEADKISITLIHQDKKYPLFAKENDSILDVVLNNKINIKGYGACDGCLSCSTCHVTFKEADYERLSTKTVEEDDMLGLTKNLTDTSRLGCQIRLTKEMDGIEVVVPDVILDIRERAPPEVDAVTV